MKIGIIRGGDVGSSGDVGSTGDVNGINDTKNKTDSIKSKENSSSLVYLEILNYSYIIIIQLFPALICAYIFNKIFFDRTDEEYKKISTFQLFIELWVQLWSILILYYIFRYIFTQIPSPFDNLLNSSFKNKLVFETFRAYIFTLVFLYCHPSLRSKILVFKERFFM